jgi:hypothetical protein
MVCGPGSLRELGRWMLLIHWALVLSHSHSLAPPSTINIAHIYSASSNIYVINWILLAEEFPADSETTADEVNLSGCNSGFLSVAVFESVGRRVMFSCVWPGN